MRRDPGADGAEIPVPEAPRSILRRQVERLADAGYTAQAASELEFFVFEESYRDAARQGHTGLTTAGWYNEDYDLLQGARHEPFVGAARRALRASGVPVENSKGEAAVGQHELNIRYADVLTMADRHVVMKHGMKTLADSLGISCTFMAKPVPGESGNSCHIHLSLWDGDASSPKNAFADGTDRTDVFRWFLAGWMAHLPELDGAVRPDRQLLQAVPGRPRGPRPASPGPPTTAPPASASSDQERAPASSAASPAAT